MGGISYINTIKVRNMNEHNTPITKYKFANKVHRLSMRVHLKSIYGAPEMMQEGGGSPAFEGI